MGSHLHDRWADWPHVTSHIWGPPPPCKQAFSGSPSKCWTRMCQACVTASLRLGQWSLWGSPNNNMHVIWQNKNIIKLVIYYLLIFLIILSSYLFDS